MAGKSWRRGKQFFTQTSLYVSVLAAILAKVGPGQTEEHTTLPLLNSQLCFRPSLGEELGGGGGARETLSFCQEHLLV